MILEAGGGADGRAWSGLLPALRRASTVCAYDRAGTGRSSPAPRPHAPQQMVEELNALLESAGVEPGYVLVGHSLGGLLVRLYASQHPGAVRGMVLLDPTTEEQDIRMWSLLPEQTMIELKASLARGPEGLDYGSFVAGMAQLRGATRSLADTPLIVLTAMGYQTSEPGIPPELGRRIAGQWLAMHADVARLSSNSVHLVLETSHDLGNDAPDVVIAAIGEVLDSARSKRRVTAEGLLSVARARGVKASRSADWPPP